jgi:hypothetical protein
VVPLGPTNAPSVVKSMTRAKYFTICIVWCILWDTPLKYVVPESVLKALKYSVKASESMVMVDKGFH